MTETSRLAPGTQTERSFLDRHSLLIVFVVALVARLLFLFLKDIPGLSVQPNPDALIYQGLARDILSGKAYGYGSHSECVAATFFIAPLYPFFLAGVYKLLGQSNQVVLVIQAILGALTALLVAVMAGKLFGRKALFMAGLLAATHPYLVTQTGELLTEVPFVLFYVGGLLLYVVALTQTSHRVRSRFSTRGIPAIVGSGILLGAAMLCRPTPLAGFPILVAALILVGRQRPVRVRLIQATLLTLATILVIGPWILRIHSRCGVWVPIATNGEFTFYVGNSHGWAEPALLREKVSAEQPSNINYFRMLGEHPPGWFARSAREEIASDWGRFARLPLVRTKQLFKVFPSRWDSPLRFLLALWTHTILFLLGIVGLAISLGRRQSFTWAILPFLLTICLLHVISIPNMRYRAGLIDVVLLVFLAGWLAEPLASAVSLTQRRGLLFFSQLLEKVQIRR
jgi:4-amino-4-deoxy-L-arabinose transferase-like glycosyltransferase